MRVKPLRLGILGATGRMGAAVRRIAESDPRWMVPVCVSEGESVDHFTARVDVVIDFSSAQGTRDLAMLAAKARMPIVIGTTGIDAGGEAAIAKAAKKSPVFRSANMSVGVYVLGALAKQAAELLGEDFDIEIVEVHHRKKIDAPSGTALLLGDRLGKKGLSPVHGRQGKPGARKSSELGYHAVRGGDVIGDHTIHFLGEGERLELTHRATNRDLFARGALQAARAITKFQPGRYDMSDVVQTHR